MGRVVVNQKPKRMPTAVRVDEITSGMKKPFFVAGCRGDNTQKNGTPDGEIHGNYTFASGDVSNLAGKHLVIFIHGYNVTADESLKSAQGFFSFLDVSLNKTLGKKEADTANYEYLLFTWPGDTGVIYFNEAQEFAQYSGAALYKLLDALYSNTSPPLSVAIVSHSLGAHVLLRSLAILGERLYRGKAKSAVNCALLLGAAVEDDVFERADDANEYHFPEAAFGVEKIHFGVSRSDDVLSGAFAINENDSALGCRGPESMDALQSLARRVEAVLHRAFSFEIHDFTPSSPTVMNPDLYIRHHGDYWVNQSQTDYYANLLLKAELK